MTTVKISFVTFKILPEAKCPPYETHHHTHSISWWSSPAVPFVSRPDSGNAANIHRFALQPIGQTGAHHCRPLQENGCVRDFDPTLLFPLQRQRKEVRLVFYEHFFLILILQNVLLGISRQNCQNQLHFFLAWFLLFPNLNSFSSFVLWSGGETPYSYSRANAMTLNCQRRQRFFRIRRSDQKLLQWECWQ